MPLAVGVLKSAFRLNFPNPTGGNTGFEAIKGIPLAQAKTPHVPINPSLTNSRFPSFDCAISMQNFIKDKALKRIFQFTDEKICLILQKKLSPGNCPNRSSNANFPEFS
jgi:hypothetical protein